MREVIEENKTFNNITEMQLIEMKKTDVKKRNQVNNKVGVRVEKNRIKRLN